MKTCLIEYLQDSFREHQSTLQDKHPGLKFDRLKNEIDEYNFCSLDKIDAILKQLLDGIPLAYIFNNTYFYRSHLWINPDIFIPRFETELLVDLALSKLALFSKKRLRMADVGIGTGAVFLSLLRDHPRPLEVYAVDISPLAIKAAKINSYRLGYSFHPESTVKFLQTDRLNDIDAKLDLIVSNPPYFKQKEDFARVHLQVQKYEPANAIFLPDENYFSWYESFFLKAYKLLDIEGCLLMEGDEEYLSKLKNLANKVGFMAVTVLKDYNNRDRFLVGHKKNKTESYG